jgi:16S rRNA (guanine(966)-N(2))-methyltransferase RsmD
MPPSAARSAKGRKRVQETMRPTLSKVREAVFNILMGRVEGEVFVDLYAGTGAIGMDAMSRGAGAVYFVEADRRRAERIKALLEGCGCRPRAHIMPMKAAVFVRKAQREGLRPDIVFLDPPYYSDELDVVLPLLGEEGLLADGGVVMAEHPSRKALPEQIGVLKKKKTYKYGDTSLSLFMVSL